MSEQKTHRAAVLLAVATPLVIETRPTPTPGPGEILVRNYAIAANPVDWKRQAWDYAIPSYPVILGSDICGIVDSVGPAVTLYKPGDRVFGLANSFLFGINDHAAFQEYTILLVDATAKLPDNMSFEQGVLMPMSTASASMALFSGLGLPLPTSEPAQTQTSALLVWGGASAVGAMAIQLANLLGFTVFATASPSHHEYLKTLGAAQVFDYRSPTAVDDIVNAAKIAGKPIGYGIDAISEAATLKPASEILVKSGGKGSKLAHMLHWAEGLVVPDGIEQSFVPSETISSKRRDVLTWLFHDFITSALEKGTIVPSSKIQIVEGGLSGLQTAMDEVKAGVSGKKVIIKLE